MADTIQNSTDCSCTGSLAETLPVDPFRSLNVHFGMLLGVEDFRVEGAYHRGKMWLHNAWLHGAGTVWGLKVTLDQERGEIQVAPGLAVDALGREIYLAQPACLNLSGWYEQHQTDPALMEVVTVDATTGEIGFDAHVVLQFKACLARQVPAFSEPCAGSNTATAYSRVVETAELLLLPGSAPAWRTPSGTLPFHRLRLLFNLEAPIEEAGDITDDDQEVLDARTDILALPSDQQPAAYLHWFRYFSAKDSMAQGPANDEDNANALFPALPPAAIPLADVASLRLMPADIGWEVVGGTVDNSIRPVLVPTSTVQELLNGPLFAAVAASLSDDSESSEAGSETGSETALSSVSPDDAGGPRIDPASATVLGEKITFNISGSVLMKASVDARGLSVTSFDVRDGWGVEQIKQVSYDAATQRVEIELRDAPGGRLVRVIIRGTGPFPWLGRNRIPLGGPIGGSPGTVDNGNDVILMIKPRS